MVPWRNFNPNNFRLKRIFKLEQGKWDDLNVLQAKTQLALKNQNGSSMHHMQIKLDL